MNVWFVSTLVYLIARVLWATMRCTIIGQEKVDAARSKHKGVIMVTWHGRTLVPINYYRGRGYWAFVSTSRDGNYQNRLLGIYGYRIVRGSTSARGAVAAALKMAKELKNGAVLMHTPDGPRGPIHVVHPGAIFLAQKSGSPVIPAGISAYPRRHLDTWDQYVVPKPFSRAVIVYGDPIEVPADIDEAQSQELCRRLGEEITRLEEQADAIVQSSSTAIATAETRLS